MLVARREQRLRAISEKARYLGANSAIVIAADVVKEDDCRRFVNETVNFYGRGKSHSSLSFLFFCYSLRFGLAINSRNH